VAFLVLFACGVCIAYSVLLVLTSAGVWMVRNQSLLEVWWLVTSLMRYPREIYQGTWAAGALGWFFTFVIPIMLVISMPACVMVKFVEPHPLAMSLTLLATALLLFMSRRFFQRALRSYRSASS
jgi:ABC-2 type transport system permease protein